MATLVTDFLHVLGKGFLLFLMLQGLVVLALRYHPSLDGARRANLFLVPLLTPVLIPLVAALGSSHVLSMDFDASRWTTPHGVPGDPGGAEIFLFSLLSICVLPAAYASAMFGLRHWACRHILARTHPLADEQNAELFSVVRQLERRLGVTHVSYRLLSDRRPRAFALGWRRPVVVVSTGLVDHLTVQELGAVLAHELAHVARGDGLLTGLAVLLRDLMFYNPLVYLPFLRLSAEMEKAADALAADVMRNPLRLAKTIIKVARIQNSARYVLTVPAFLGTGLFRSFQRATLEERIIHLATYTPKLAVRPYGSLPTIVIGLTKVSLIIVVFDTLTQLSACPF